jgi:hypothetical protein
MPPGLREASGVQERQLWDTLVRSVPGPTKDDLCYIIRNVEPLRQEAWQKLFGQQPNNDDLRYIIENVEPLRQEAWQKLLGQRPNNGDLCYIIRNVEPLCQEAWQKLLGQQPTTGELRYIIESVEPLRAAATRLLPVSTADAMKAIRGFVDSR